MAVVAIYSVKGGVGKTTTSANLAWCSARISKRATLLWDLDAAGGAGFLLGMGAKQKKRAESVFALDRSPAKLIRKSGIPRLDLLPADESIRALDSQLTMIGKKKRLVKLTQALAKDYDRILFDCPPVLNELSAQVMRASDLVIVPIPPSPLSARAFDLVVEEVERHTKVHPPILPVLSMLDMRKALHRSAREENPRWPAIPYASAAEQCAVRQQPVGEFAPTSVAQPAYRSLWTAIERKLVKGKAG
ncbi:ParA family protein [Erythrobacter litoralis]|uniref:ATPase, ParA family protein n=1 Tax=Erythrobacter litoralis (strain HTCC2594) TaxID=314225 RepID=Q2N7Q2_ERYLH|nr:ParA family protein [Erythrobacter litoralis]ABC64289.1 ATPase, ParA family protein [Erythrobacter litoralis HTCC2594]